MLKTFSCCTSIHPDQTNWENISLYELLGRYERERLKSRNESLQLKDYNMYLRRRTAKPYIITHRVVSPSSHRNTRNWTSINLFKPWRVESDLCLPGKSYHEIYVQERHILPDMQDHEMHVYILERIKRRLGSTYMC